MEVPRKKRVRKQLFVDQIDLLLLLTEAGVDRALWTQPPCQCAVAETTEIRRLAEIRSPS